MNGTDPVNALEALDPDFHLVSFFMPASRRAAAVALFVFEAELSRIATLVSEPMVAQIRYAWWREQVDAMFSGRPIFAPHAQALAEAVRTHKLSRAVLDAMIDAHCRDCDAAPFETLDHLVGYCAQTTGGLIKLLGCVLGADRFADEAAEHAGIAYGLSAQLLGCSHWLKHRRLRLPLDLVHHAGMTETDMFSGDVDGARLKLVLNAVREKITDRLVRLNRSRFPRAATPALALATLSRSTLSKRFDLLQPRHSPPWIAVLRLARAQILWRF